MFTQISVAFVTNICDHYSVRLFEILARRFDAVFYFTGVGENYRKNKARRMYGDFPHKDLPGFYVSSRFRVTPGIFAFLFKQQDVFIKSIDDRFALPLVFLIAKLRRTPFILWAGIWQHPSTLFHRISYAFTVFIYHHAQAIVVYGEHIKRYLVSLGVDEKKVFCAPHAVDNVFLSIAVTEDQKKDLRRQLGVGDKKVVLFVGRLEECKGLNFLIDAMCAIKGSGAALVVIGDGAWKGRYQQQAKDTGVDVRFLDFVANAQLPHYYALARVFVLPSVTTADFKEPWGLVVNEAMNQGCPVIASDAVGAAAGGLVKDGTNGFIVPQRDSRALAKSLEILLTDGHLRATMSENARREVSRWTHEGMADGFAAAIRHALDRKQQKTG